MAINDMCDSDSGVATTYNFYRAMFAHFQTVMQINNV